MAVLALGLAYGPAPGQQAVSPVGLPDQAPSIVPLDQAVEDLGPLSSSLRQVQMGLDPFNGFDRVFRLPGDSGKLMRVQGGLYAIFDESVYVGGQGGLLAVVPANTTFWIGPPPDLLGTENSPEPAFRDRIDNHVAPLSAATPRPDAARSARSTGPSSGPIERAAPPRTHEGRIVWDGEYRARRLRLLMAQAARAAAP